MKTAARAMILASLVGTVACSGATDEPNPLVPDPTGDPTGVGPGVAPGPVGTNPDGTPVPGGVNPGGTGTAGPGPTPVGPNPSVPSAPTTGQCQPGVPVTSQVPRLTNLQYDTAVRHLFNVSSPSGSWSDTFEPDSVGLLTGSQWTLYKSTADKIATAVMSTPLGGELTTAAADVDTFEAAIRSLGRKVFRRPLTNDEVASFLSLADVEPAGTPAEIAEALVYTMLVSPSFLMRTELDAPTEPVPGTTQVAFKLSSHEVASRLSFLIWNSVPDDILSAAADAGELETKEQIAAQAQRMLAPEFKDRVVPVISAAHAFWADINETSSTSRWGKTTHDKDIFPEYSDAQNAVLLEETRRFFAEVGYSGQFEDLFLSNLAFVNNVTAPLYGVDGSFGADLQQVELNPMERPGFLTRGGFLGSFAHLSQTSPILRGVYILKLMGAQTGTPSPAALETALPPGDYKTNREATTALTSVAPDCVACHQRVINPPGFVMESYSAVGTIQTVDPKYGGEIDTRVEGVPFPSGAKPINNAYELMSELAQGRLTKEIYAEKWVSYATGRDANDFDKCTAIAIADKIEAGGYNLASVLADLTQADSFRLRVAAE